MKRYHDAKEGFCPVCGEKIENYESYFDEALGTRGAEFVCSCGVKGTQTYYVEIVFNCTEVQP